MTQATWQDHFKSYIKSAEGLYSKDTTDVSFLMFCLRSKTLPTPLYLDWAKEHFQLPVISEKFFQIHKPQPELYKKWQKVHKWSAECLPLAEWDGTLIIACLEKPLDYKHTNPTVFVLTPPQFLDQTWALYNKKQHSPDMDLADMTAFAATVVAPTSGKNDFFDENGSLVLKDNVEDATAESEILEGPEEASSEEEIDRTLIAEEASGSPEGLFGDNPAPSISFAKITPTTDELPPVPEAALKKGPRTVEPLLSEVLEASEENTNITEDPPAMPAPAPPRMNLNSSGAVYVLEKLRKQNPEEFDKELVASFAQLKTFFKKSMLFAVGDKDRLLKPILWDSGFDVQSPQNPEINLKTPSIFRIVNGTQKPYHGYVVVNDLNESFFEAWNHGQVPDHVTLVPVMDKDQLVGMLMGLGEKACYNKSVLQFTEDVAKKLSARILKPAVPNVAA